MLAEPTALQELGSAEPEPFQWVESDCAIYVRDAVYGRCVAFARRRVCDRQWEVKLTGPQHPVHVVAHRGKARGKLRRLVAGIEAAA